MSVRFLLSNSSPSKPTSTLSEASIISPATVASTTFGAVQRGSCSLPPLRTKEAVRYWPCLFSSSTPATGNSPCSVFRYSSVCRQQLRGASPPSLRVSSTSDCSPSGSQPQLWRHRKQRKSLKWHSHEDQQKKRVLRRDERTRNQEEYERMMSPYRQFASR